MAEALAKTMRSPWATPPAVTVDVEPLRGLRQLVIQVPFTINVYLGRTAVCEYNMWITLLCNTSKIIYYRQELFCCCPTLCRLRVFVMSCMCVLLCLFATIIILLLSYPLLPARSTATCLSLSVYVLLSMCCACNNNNDSGRCLLCEDCGGTLPRECCRTCWGTRGRAACSRRCRTKAWLTRCPQA